MQQPLYSILENATFMVGPGWQVILKYTTADLAPGSSLPTVQEQIDLVLKVYNHTLKRAELRDEIFAQLSKQTRNNPDR